MSDQNPTTNQSSNSTPPQMVTEPVVPTPPPPKPDLPPLSPIPEPPPSMNPPSTTETFTVSTTTHTETPSAPPPPPVKTASDKPGMSKTIIGVLVALLLTAGIGAGVVLVGQNQDIRQRAQVYPSPSGFASPSPSGGANICGALPPDNCIVYYCPNGCTRYSDCCPDGTHNCSANGQGGGSTQCALPECRSFQDTPIVPQSLQGTVVKSIT